jgi:hypothetical protein
MNTVATRDYPIEIEGIQKQTQARRLNALGAAVRKAKAA